MEILGLEKVSLVDYEGYVCATVFTGGCNFLCPFCHNSGLVRREVRPLNIGEVKDYLIKRKGLLDAVTISGGEPTLQPDLKLFMRFLKDLGYKVKLDTNGAMPEVLADIIESGLVDYVAMDIKNDFDDYSKIVGLKRAPVEKVRKSLKILRESGIDYELRTTLVSEFHKLENIEKMREDLKGEKKLYLQKFVDSGALIGEELGLKEVELPLAKKFRSILSETIESVELRGY